MEMLRRRIGDFYTVEHIGSGGMSQVYLAVNPRNREKRAVKVLARRATSPVAELARFRREIEIIRALQHPNIVRIMESGAEDGFYYYMMEYLPSGSLARRLARGRVPLQEALPFFAEVVGAIAYAHTQGIVHRDLKPANVLIRESGAPVVTDFGIAKTLDADGPSVTMSNEILGTIAYLAPEQRLSSKRVDRRADVFALGSIFYEMLMGFPPLGKFPWPHETQPEFPSEVEALLERMLAIDPERRFADAGRLSGELKVFQGGSQASAIRTVESLDMDDAAADIARTDRLDLWFDSLRNGTTRERLATVRTMIDSIRPGEVQAILKLYTTTPERVRWGLIRLFGELRVGSATHLMLAELRNANHREAAAEALGKIGAEEAFEPLLRQLESNPQSAPLMLTPLMQTGRERALGHVKPYLRHEMATVRLAAVRAIASTPTSGGLEVLRPRLESEKDDKVRREVHQSVASLEAVAAGAATVVLRKTS